jgi:hypothetical protein
MIQQTIASLHPEPLPASYGELGQLKMELLIAY